MLGERPSRINRDSNFQEKLDGGLSWGVKDNALEHLATRRRELIEKWISTPANVSDLSFEEVKNLPDSNVSQKGQQSELLWESVVCVLLESTQQSLITAFWSAAAIRQCDDAGNQANNNKSKINRLENFWFNLDDFFY